MYACIYFYVYIYVYACVYVYMCVYVRSVTILHSLYSPIWHSQALRWTSCTECQQFNLQSIALLTPYDDNRSVIDGLPWQRASDAPAWHVLATYQSHKWEDMSWRHIAHICPCTRGPASTTCCRHCPLWCRRSKWCLCMWKAWHSQCPRWSWLQIHHKEKTINCCPSKKNYKVLLLQHGNVASFKLIEARLSCESCDVIGWKDCYNVRSLWK